MKRSRRIVTLFAVAVAGVFIGSTSATLQELEICVKPNECPSTFSVV